MQEGSNRRPVILALFALIAIALVTASLGGCGDDEADSTTTTTTSANANANANACKRVKAAAPKKTSFKAPKQVLAKGEAATAVVKTSCGTFEIALDTERAPKTANSFAFLAEEGFYDGIGFHRVAPGFVIQGGDPLGNGTGGPGYTVDEKPPGNLAYTKGVVAMAKSSADPPGRSGSQFYVVTAPDAGLPPEYALVGRVSDGYDVVARIDRLGTPAETPKQPVLIDSVTIEKS
ncbi:MAG TPA: peptidylprolyl isomerase [Solirubrobacterales bacterium]|nr:peptidylprolyl isomerase [Solirubrobacterales bacterium]